MSEEVWIPVNGTVEGMEGWYAFGNIENKPWTYFKVNESGEFVVVDDAVFNALNYQPTNDLHSKSAFPGNQQGPVPSSNTNERGEDSVITLREKKESLSSQLREKNALIETMKREKEELLKLLEEKSSTSRELESTRNHELHNMKGEMDQMKSCK